MRYAKDNHSLFVFSPTSSVYSKSMPRTRHAMEWRSLTAWLVIQDALLIYIALQVAYLIRFTTSLSLFQQDVQPSVPFYRVLSLVLVPVWVGLFALHGLYSRQNLSSGTRETAVLFNATLTCTMIVVAGEFLWVNMPVARGWLIVAWFFTFLFIALGRYIVRRVMQRLRTRGVLVSPTVIVGANQEGQMLVEQLMRQEYSGLQVVGVYDDLVPAGTAIYGDIKVAGTLNDIDDAVADSGVEEIIVASSALDQTQVLQLFAKYGICDNLNIRMSTGLYQVITTGLQVTEFAFVPLVKINKVRLTGMEGALKGLLDFVLALVGVIVFSPIFAVIAALVKLNSPGPVIHRRRVMGVNGQQFDAFKFRTMYVDGDAMIADQPELLEELARTQKLKNDPRVTKIGAFLRKTSIDELPQLINVLKQQMSLVGPRMISPPEMEYYKHMGMNLLTVKPGLTGLWQVSGRSDVSYEERVRLDMYYIRNWNIWLDLQILWRTLPAVFFRRGAY